MGLRDVSVSQRHESAYPSRDSSGHLEKLPVSESANQSPSSQQMSLWWLLRGTMGFSRCPKDDKNQAARMQLTGNQLTRLRQQEIRRQGIANLRLELSCEGLRDCCEVHRPVGGAASVRPRNQAITGWTSRPNLPCMRDPVCSAGSSTNKTSLPISMPSLDEPPHSMTWLCTRQKQHSQASWVGGSLRRRVLHQLPLCSPTTQRAPEPGPGGDC